MVMPAASVAALVARGILDDPWAGGRERLDLDPVVLSGAEVEALACTACTVLMALDELVPAVAARADLLAAVGLDASLRAITALDAPRWLGLARVDVFATGDALPQACEVNCDTPTGLAETTELGRLGAVEHPHLRDPSARLGERWTAMVRDAAPDGDPRPVVGILDPTEMTEDLGHLRLISGWLGAAGCRVVRGSPFNLHAMPGGRVGLFGQPCTVLVRHYKADWWGGRQPIWSDVPPPPDAAPLSRGLDLILSLIHI